MNTDTNKKKKSFDLNSSLNNISSNIYNKINTKKHKKSHESPLKMVIENNELDTSINTARIDFIDSNLNNLNIK
jgi:hypothetical protein